MKATICALCFGEMLWTFQDTSMGAASFAASVFFDMILIVLIVKSDLQEKTFAVVPFAFLQSSCWFCDSKTVTVTASAGSSTVPPAVQILMA
jgi:hypothetical protein